MTFFIIYPHCFFYTTPEGVIFFDPTSKEFLCGEDSSIISFFNKNDKSSLVFNLNNADDLIRSFIDHCVQKKFGFILDKCNSLPFQKKQNLNIISSYSKLSGALGYADGFHVSDMINHITLYFDNEYYDPLSKQVYTQIGYPTYRTSYSEKYYEELMRGYFFKNLELIILSGDINSKKLNSFLGVLKEQNILIRTIYRLDLHNYIEHILSNFPQIRIELLIDNHKYISHIKSLQNSFNRLILSPIIDNVNNLQFYLKDDLSYNYTPIVYDKNAQVSLVQEMILNKNDIISQNIDIDTAFKNEHINLNTFGKITLKSNGQVFSFDELMGDLNNCSMIEILNNWLHNTTSNWLLTRLKREQCSRCVFALLCPPISVYEFQGVINKACEV